MGGHATAGGATSAWRLDRERVIWWFRLAATVFCLIQTVLSPGDSLIGSLVILAALAVSTAMAGLLLAHSPTDRVVRGVGVGSMTVDALVIAGLLANNLTDPAEPIYLVVVLGTLEAAMRWDLPGGWVAGVASGAATALWGVVVYTETGMAVQISYVTMMAAAVALFGVFIGWIMGRLGRERRALQQTLDVSRDLIATTDEAGIVLSMNHASLEVLGYGSRDLVGQTYRSFVHPEDRASIDAGLAELLVPGEVTVRVEGRFRCADGSYRWLELSATSVADEPVIYVVARDVTERREVAHRLAVSEQRFRSLFDHTADAVYAFDLEGRLTTANPATAEMIGAPVEEIVGTDVVSLIAPEHWEHTRRAFRDAAGGAARTYDTALDTGDGRRIELHATNMPIIVNGEVVGVYGVSKDVTERRQLERALAYQARHDRLTGLGNRLGLDELLARRLTDEDHAGTGLLFIDLDGFKEVNDSLGHRIGDALLVAVAERIGDGLRAEDVLMRWAGDEFCAVLAGVTDAAVAHQAAERVLGHLVDTFELGGHHISVSASIGSTVAREGVGPDDLMRRADTAMYAAKRAGGGRVRAFEHAAEDIHSPLDRELEAPNPSHSTR